MNPMTRHPTKQGVTYWKHFHFAMGVAARLLTSVLAFAIHALLPFVPIEPKNDLEATAAFLQQRNDWIGAASGRRTEHQEDDHGRGSLVGV
jgi:hypothetical protein